MKGLGDDEVESVEELGVMARVSDLSDWKGGDTFPKLCNLKGRNKQPGAGPSMDRSVLQGTPPLRKA